MKRPQIVLNDQPKLLLNFDHLAILSLSMKAIDIKSNFIRLSLIYSLKENAINIVVIQTFLVCSVASFSVYNLLNIIYSVSQD